MVVWINPTLWCASGCHSDSLDVWRSKEMRCIRIWKMFAEIQPWYFVAVLNKEEMILKTFSQLKCMLLEVLNLKCATGPMPLTSVYPPLSRKNQRNCDWKTIFVTMRQTYSGEMFCSPCQSSTVSCSSHRSIDDEGAMRGIKKKPIYLAKQFIQLRTNW